MASIQQQASSTKEQAATVQEITTTMEEITQSGAQISARAKQRGRPRPQNDTWIAACCLHYGLPLATLNVKDFEDFATYERLSLITA